MHWPAYEKDLYKKVRIRSKDLTNVSIPMKCGFNMCIM